jgi:hypothetical protein
MSVINNEADKIIKDISEIVDIWLEGNIKEEYFCKVNDIANVEMDMDSIKKIYYNLFVNELKKQSKMDNIDTIEKHIGGSLHVFFDEEGILVCIVNDAYYDTSDSYDSTDDNHDY